MSIVIEQTGLFDSLQDAGRKGFRHFGVPASGWFDPVHAQIANAMVGNQIDAPCLETTMKSGLFRCIGPVRIGIAGPGCQITIIRHQTAPVIYHNNVICSLLTGDRFSICHPKRGVRSYIAAAGGGWLGKPVMGSVSSESRFVKDAVIKNRKPTEPQANSEWTRYLTQSWLPNSYDRECLNFVPSDPCQLLLERNPELKNLFCRVIATSQSNRMGLRFEIDPATTSCLRSLENPNRLSQPVIPGSIQWTGGQIIILGVSSGTMGGYGLIGQITGWDLPRLGQIRPGDPIRLQAQKSDEARQQTDWHQRNHQKRLDQIKIACSI